jgi:Domain of unknown function (DUF4157)
MTTTAEYTTARERPVSDSGALLQRTCSCGQHAIGGECDECRRRRQSAERPTSALAHLARSSGRSLEPALRASMETRFGHDFSGVRVHTDAPATTSAREVGARAYTTGEHVVFNAGGYAPGTAAGERLLAHELTHVVQQRGIAAGAPAVSDPSDSSEREAERVAAAVTRGATAPAVSVRAGGIQRDLGSTLGAAGEALGKVAGAVAALLKTGSFKVSMKPFVTGLEGTIEFDPDAKLCPKCKLIRLVQVTRVSEKPGVDYPWTGKEAPREKTKTAADKTKGVKENYFVDHLAAGCTAGKGCSLYYRDHWANAKSSQDGANDGKTAKKASLWDRPFGDADDVFEFETCARCANTGNFLRCVDWGFTADSKGAVTASATSEHPIPSATFSAALATFNKYYGNK